MTNLPDNPSENLTTIEMIKEQYVMQPVTDALTKQQQILDESFALVAANKNLLEDIYERLAAVYNDAKTVFKTLELDDLHKQSLLYPIYEEYFSIISILSWKKRRTIKADRLIRKMKTCLKQSIPKSSSVKFWIRYCQTSVPLFAVFLIFEILFLDLLGSDAPYWQTGLAFLAFVVSSGAYLYVSYTLEGLRLYGNLQQWTQYLKNPQGYNKPIGLIQMLKLVVAPLATIGSAIIKIYLQK